MRPKLLIQLFVEIVALATGLLKLKHVRVVQSYIILCWQLSAYQKYSQFLLKTSNCFMTNDIEKNFAYIYGQYTNQNAHTQTTTDPLDNNSPVDGWRMLCLKTCKTTSRGIGDVSLSAPGGAWL